MLVQTQSSSQAFGRKFLGVLNNVSAYLKLNFCNPLMEGMQAALQQEHADTVSCSPCNNNESTAQVQAPIPLDDRHQEINSQDHAASK